MRRAAGRGGGLVEPLRSLCWAGSSAGRSSWAVAELVPGRTPAAVAAVQAAIGRGRYQVNVVRRASAPHWFLPALRPATLPGPAGASAAGVKAGGGDRLRLPRPWWLWPTARCSPGRSGPPGRGRAGAVAGVGEGTRRTHHDRRFGRNDRPGGRTGRCVDNCTRCGAGDLWQAESVKPPGGPGGPGRPATGGAPGRVGHRCPQAGGAGGDRRDRWDEAPAWARSVVGHGWLDLGLTIRTVAADGHSVHVGRWGILTVIRLQRWRALRCGPGARVRGDGGRAGDPAWPAATQVAGCGQLALPPKTAARASAGHRRRPAGMPAVAGGDLTTPPSASSPTATVTTRTFWPGPAPPPDGPQLGQRQPGPPLVAATDQHDGFRDSSS